MSMKQEWPLYKKKNEVAIEFSRRRVHVRSTSRMTVIRIVLDYKRATQNRRESVVRIQLALCEVASELNSRGLKSRILIKTFLKS